MTSSPGCGGGDSTISLNQTWSQEPQGYERVVDVRAPESCSSGQKFPVVIDLHGNGGQGNLQRLSKVFGDTVVLVAPSGYERSWNIISENSKAPDVDFIVDLIAEVGEAYPQADMDDVTIVGTSNGAAMIQRLLIEVPKPQPFHRVIPMISNLAKFQYNGTSFFKRTDETSENYDEVVVPASPGPQFIYFHGTEDPVIPYDGGMGLGLEFWSSQEGTYIWAKYWGEKGDKLADGAGVETSSGMFMYSYLDGGVVHYKVPGAGHGVLGPGDKGDEVKKIIKNAVLGLEYA